MNYWYINTEAKDFDGDSPDAKWLKHGRAFVSGKGYDRKLQRLHPDDICFMYANKRGVVAVGRVLERCDGRESEPRLVYCRPDQGPEYQTRVDWFLTFPHNAIPPIKLREIIGWTSPQTIQRIADPVAAEALRSHARQQAERE
jgi:hypothetical protein